MKSRRNLTLLGLLIVLPAAVPAPPPAAPRPDAPMADPEAQKEGDWVDARWQKTEVGRFLSGAINTPGRPTYKGIAIKLGEHGEASVCFDTDLLRMSAGWTGGFVKPDPARYGLIKPIALDGELVFVTPARPGWANEGSFTDPRPRPFGPLPREQAKYRGLYLHGSRVVLHYTVGEADVWESPWCESREGLLAITRSLEIGPAKTSMELALHQTLKETDNIISVEGLPIRVSPVDGDTIRATAMVNASGERFSSLKEGLPALVIPPHENVVRVKLYQWKGPRAALTSFASLVKASAKPEELSALTRGGPPHWGEPLVTRGQVDLSTRAFAIDTLTMPYQNPWNALMFAGGHDFFPDGDAAVCTVHGDVWRVSGIDDRLAALRWKRFATGLYQPLGLKIVNGNVYVLGRDQITILEDLNNDGEADHYVNFNNDAEVDSGGHGYATCLETDSRGNFYYLRCASGTIHSGSLLRVSPDGRKLDVTATGFRNPNGMSIAPDDTITVADQEGEWVPATRLDVIKPGGFYGYMPAHHRTIKPEKYDAPLCWMPKVADNSAGGQVWITGGDWNGLKGQLLHLSFGHCSMLLGLREEIDGQAQGGVVPLPGRFLSGVMRGVFRPGDGHLYVSGLRGWQTSAARDGCFQRVRCRPEKVQVPILLNAHSNGLRLTFNAPLQRSTAEDPGSFAVERWNYHWTATYGSKDWSVVDPARQGHDAMTVTSAQLSADGKSIFLEIPDLKPAMQMHLRYNLNSAGGKAAPGEVFHTIHRLGPAWVAKTNSGR